MFIDEVTIEVSSGKGGDGSVHFRREKYVPFGGPDGGDGGRGGDVLLVVKPTLNTLSHFHHQTKFRAQDGAPGAKQNMSGASGQDLVLEVPPGTLVYDAANGETLGDLTSIRTNAACSRRRAGRKRQRPLRHRHQSGAAHRRARRAGTDRLPAPGAEADRRCGHRRRAQRRKIYPAGCRDPRQAEDRRLSVYNAGA